MSFDPKDYLGHLEDFEMSEAEKLAYIETMWLVMQSFADQAWGIAPATQIEINRISKNGNHNSDLVDLMVAGTGQSEPANDNTQTRHRKKEGSP
ncbi:MAG: hypothetical protein AAGC70_09095 [Pseudomonadota bacterium]